jgi:ribosomal protein S6
MQYELFYLVGERNELNLQTIREEVSQVLLAEKATLVEPELTEKRKLAYEIKHQSKGTYVTRRFDLPDVDYWASPENSEKEFGIEAITKKLNLMNTVLRHMIVKTSELPELGSKEKRQQQEQKDGKNIRRPENKPTRQDQRPMQRRENSRPQYAQRPTAAPVKEETAVIEKVEKAVETPVKKEVAKAKPVAKETSVEKEAPKVKEPKKVAQDIDKQLEELLNI